MPPERLTIKIDVSPERKIYGSLIQDNEYGDSTLDNVVAWLGELREQVPEEFRSNIKIKVDSHEGYEGSHSATIHVYYNRPETDDELAKRERLEAKRIKNAQAYELSELARLKQKYGQ